MNEWINEMNDALLVAFYNYYFYAAILAAIFVSVLLIY